MSHLMFAVKLDNWYILWCILASQLLRSNGDGLIFDSDGGYMFWLDKWI